MCVTGFTYAYINNRYMVFCRNGDFSERTIRKAFKKAFPKLTRNELLEMRSTG